MDDDLLIIIASEIEREGGKCALERIPVYNRQIQKLLASSKLFAFVRAHPNVFLVETELDCTAKKIIKVQLSKVWKDKIRNKMNLEMNSIQTPNACVTKNPETCSDIEKSHFCNYCSQAFHSRNALFKHLKFGFGDNGAVCQERAFLEGMQANLPHVYPSPELTNETQVHRQYFEHKDDLKNILMYSLLQKRREGNDLVSLKLLAFSRKIKNKLHLYLRSLPLSELSFEQRFEPFSSNWWIIALRYLGVFLTKYPGIFNLLLSSRNQDDRFLTSSSEILQLADNELGNLSAKLSECCSKNEEDFPLGLKSKIQCRARLIIQQNIETHKRYVVALARIGRDAQIQKMLEGRSLTEAVNDCGFLETFQGQNDLWFCRLTRDQDKDQKGDSLCDNTTEIQHTENTKQLTSDEVSKNILLSLPDIVFLNKPSGISTENLVFSFQRFTNLNSSFLANDAATLKTGSSNYTIQTVSRLDQPTSGVIVLPLSLEREKYLTNQFKARQIHKVYIALVVGRTEPAVTVNAKLLHVESNGVQKSFVHHKGKAAETRFITLGHFATRNEGEEYSLVRVTPITGRTHQIRAHSEHIGHPLVGDNRYNKHSKKTANWCPRLFLHAASIEFTSMEGAPVFVEAQLPPDLKGVLEHLDEIHL